MNDVVIYWDKNAEYPCKENLFRPSVKYPEYLFEEISSEVNYVYGMVRESFHLAGYDSDNYGKSTWNPLKNFIKHGDTVLIKPNMVKDFNSVDNNVDCLYTHPSLVAAVVDYVIIALFDKEKFNGKIIIGDAPLQTCDFDNLLRSSGYKKLLNYYESKGINIGIHDFRNTKSKLENNILHMQNETQEGVLVNLGQKSAFYELSAFDMDNLRVTCYPHKILHQHHNLEKHEYKIATDVLSADVIINIPKPKTHRKAGITGALKNLVGICAEKAYLPHHRRLSVEEGGDAYLYKNKLKRIRDDVLDIRNEAAFKQDENIQSMAMQVINYLDNEIDNGHVCDVYNEGSWYGNDTIWRTISDLNKIVFYADKNGVLQKTKQRRYIAIGDMIVSGHKEGPLEPEPIYPRAIVVSEDPVNFDRVVASFMGYDYKDISTLNNSDIKMSEHCYHWLYDHRIRSNNKLWDKKQYIAKKDSMKFIPSRGWENKLGNHITDIFINQIKDANKKVYIWGGGEYGLKLLDYCCINNVKIEAILDINISKHKNDIMHGIPCISPYQAMLDSVCVVAVSKKLCDEVKMQAQQMGFYNVVVL